ncbi:MAG: MFS transporter [Ilumatobacter sp.]
MNQRRALTSSHSLGAGFRALFYGSLVTNTGDGIRLAALPLLAAQLTSSPLVIATVTAAQYLPWFSFAPVGGVVVDRWDRRRVIVGTQAFRGLVMVALAMLVLVDAVAVWHLCIVAFVITAGEILVDPAIVALVPTVVDDEDLDRANGRISSAEIITNDFAGPPVGAAAFAWAPWIPLVVDAVSYLGSTFPFSRLPKQAVQPRGTLAFRADAKAGFSFLRSHPLLGPFTLSQVVYYFGVSSGLSLMVVLVTQEIGESSFMFGIVLAAGAVGAVGGSLAGSGVARALGRRVTLAGAVALQGLALIAAMWVGAGWQLAVIWFLAGFPTGVQRPVARSLQQRLTPNDLLGRVNISARALTRGVIIIGALSSGAIASALGVRWAFAMGGAVELTAALAMWRALNAVDDRNSEPRSST